jgi:hypothetical protein
MHEPRAGDAVTLVLCRAIHVLMASGGGEHMSSSDKRLWVDLNNSDELAVLRDVADDYGLTLEPVRPRDMGVITAVFLVGAAAVVAQAVQTFADRKKGGQVIDMRPGATPVRRDKGLLYGLILVITPDGQFEIKVWEPKNHLAEVVKDVLEAIRSVAGVGDAVRAASGAVGERGELTRTDDDSRA